MWIDPTCPGGPWFSPQTDQQQSRVILDAKVDGLFYHSVSANGASLDPLRPLHAAHAGKLAEHTWVCEATKGRESIVTTTFEARDGGTFVKVVHAASPTTRKAVTSAPAGAGSWARSRPRSRSAASRYDAHHEKTGRHRRRRSLQADLETHRGARRLARQDARPHAQAHPRGRPRRRRGVEVDGHAGLVARRHHLHGRDLQDASSS